MSMRPETIDGVYLCDTLDLERLFAPTLAQLPNLRMFRPEGVPDDADVRLAIAYRPRQGAFQAFPDLELVQSIAAGVDGILADRSLPPDVPVARVRDPEQASIMAGFAAWHVVWHHRNMRHYLDAARRGEWSRVSFNGLRAPSSTVVGVLGYGTMGRAVARALAGLGFDVRAASLFAHDEETAVCLLSGPDAPRRLAIESDILINLLPLTADTRGLIDADFLASMPQGSALIQLARGEHLDEVALLEALDRGHLSGASLDVFATEPLPPDHPFWTHPLVVVTPHEASVLPASAVAKALRDSLEDLRAGRTPRTAVDRRKGY
ncbi:NAD(P)-dependent oxidoreductase [Paracoccus rhizosphaerae]|uniref:NAD(P)-dependent oxidoreductase n=1 Tax=Paracoccus rhizosphaerae TaxID=1133347 RepID=A0ABV6CMP5_9RHOB|nr:NAD(P)-dependent oxidoreductase [Paracoccus rhizosphaerae]